MSELSQLLVVALLVTSAWACFEIVVRDAFDPFDDDDDDDPPPLLS